MITPIFNTNILKVLTVFSVSPGSKFSRKDIKEKTGLNNVVLDNSIQVLLNSKVLIKEKRFLMLNLNDQKDILNIISKQYKKLKELPFDVYFSIVGLVDALSRSKDLDVYLFGSFAKLVFNQRSDIDIAVISNKVDKILINKSKKKLESKYKKKIEIHFFSNDFYKNKTDALVKEILKNGVKLI